ncbi:MAG: DEAD/DEAH box helicase [Bacillota bacterium]
MEFVPHKYQEMAYQKILNTKKVGLFLDMGLGKTVITLTAIVHLMFRLFEIDCVLVIAPLRVAEDTWAREIYKWDHLKHLKISKILGNKQQRLQALYAEADIYIINRENVEWLVNEMADFNDWPFDMVVLDELSSFKSPKSKRFKALKKCILKSSRIVGLTGTPSPNGLIDLWSQIYLLDGGERLGRTLTAYRTKYFLPDKRNATTIFSYRLNGGAEAEIKNRISDICMSMTAKDWLDMPERIDNIYEIHMTEKERGDYESFEREMVAEFLTGEVTATSKAALTTKLLQYCNGAMYLDGGGYTGTSESKLNALEDVIESANGKSVLCFYEFKHDLERIQNRFKEAVKINNSKDLEQWNRGEIPLYLAHPMSAGHGLNMQDGGCIIVWFGLTWSLELYLQANARLHRQGQKKSVIIHHLIVKDTIEERVYNALQQKQDVQNDLIESLKAKYKV